jgi:hypothetical protein
LMNELRESLEVGQFGSCGVTRSNDQSSATASAARVERTVRSRFPATLERTAQRPFAAAHG